MVIMTIIHVIIITIMAVIVIPTKMIPTIT